MSSNWSFVKLGHFPAHCLVSYNMTYDDLIKSLRRKKYPDWITGLDKDNHLFTDKRSFALHRQVECGKEEKDLFYILLKDNVKLDDSGYITIAHEVLHIVQFVSRFVCADMIEETESSAYLHSALMQHTIEIIRDAIKKN